MDETTAKRQTDAIERIMRRWLLEEATGNQGATVDMTVAPNAARDTWRYPYWPAHDVAWEEER